MARDRAKSHGKPAATVQPASVRDADALTPVTFAQAHTHRGVPFGKGDVYQATPQERELLQHFNVIEVP